PRTPPGGRLPAGLPYGRPTGDKVGRHRWIIKAESPVPAGQSLDGIDTREAPRASPEPSATSSPARRVPGCGGRRRGRARGRPATPRPGSGALAHVLATVGVDRKRLCAALDHLAVDDDLLDAGEAREIEHRLEQDVLHDRAQAA